jgi:hypothetical protein
MMMMLKVTFTISSCLPGTSLKTSEPTGCLRTISIPFLARSLDAGQARGSYTVWFRWNERAVCSVGRSG